MSWTLVDLADVPATPWRNGGGVTRELLAWPSPANWQVRLSVADVGTDGPFSMFPAIERWFAVLEGSGMRLTVDGHVHTCTTASAPLRFDGGAVTQGMLLAGSTRDFNLMALPGHARMQRVRESSPVQATGGSLVAAYAHAGSAQLVDASGTAFALPPRTLAWQLLDAPTSWTVEAPALLWIEVTR